MEDDFHGNVKQQFESKNSFISMTRSWDLFMYSLSEWTIKAHRLAHERWEPAWGLCQHRWRLLCSYPVVDIHLSVPHWDPLIKHWKNISSFSAKDKTNQSCFGGRAHYLIWISSCSITFSVFCLLLMWIYSKSLEFILLAFIGLKGQKRWGSSLRLEKVFALSRSLFRRPSGRAGHFERL